MKLYWSGTTRYHDWYKNRNEIPRQIFENINDLQVFDQVEWMYEGMYEDEKKPVEKGFDVIQYLLKIKEKKNGSFCVNLGSSKPFDWEANLLLFPYVSSMKQIRGMNRFNFYFQSDHFLADDGSDLLAETFKKAHTIQDTEFAFIHPNDRYSELTDSLDGEYQNPLTFGPMFNGIFWLIFLGKQHLDFFDIEKLQNIKCYQHEWVNNNEGLYMRMTKNILDVITPEIERDMFQLTKQFKEALLVDI
ncbi:hypothetical protein [Aquimarina mytili]|uniref:Uncharacterized protein n=1 Tax=Aquimarina mytili TaxID=874423 RepID=A0A937A3S5_9FLAO|nr:hypothetical protein [Aquimarina mytili]MBL0683839.1 hypothetical protein [Aquimarina mytili]